MGYCERIHTLGQLEVIVPVYAAHINPDPGVAVLAGLRAAAPDLGPAGLPDVFPSWALHVLEGDLLPRRPSVRQDRVGRPVLVVELLEFPRHGV